LFHCDHFILKVSIWKFVCIDCFHMYFTWSQTYWVIIVLSNYPHYNFQCYTLQFTSCHNPPKVQIPNILSSILINLFNSIKFLLYIDIGIFGCKYYKTFSTTIIHWDKDFKWFHFCEYDVINMYIQPMAHFLYVMHIF